MEKFVALAASGVAYGAVLALLALGLLLLFRATGIVNFAHGDLVTTGAYIALWGVATLHLPTLLAYGISLIAMFVAGLVVGQVAYVPLRRQSPLVVMIATLAIGIAIEGLLSSWQGAEVKAVPSPLGLRTIHLAGAAISDQGILIVVVTAAAVIGLLLMFHRTRFGRQVRALADDAEVARLCGVRTRRVAMVSFGLSAFFAGLAGILVGPLGAIDPTFGFNLMLSAFAASALGGFGSFGGVVVGGILVGLVEQLLGGYLFPNYADIFPYVLILVVIAIRPSGLVSLNRSRL
jgi:branched-chain amino acid transport system permease protein